MQTRGIQILLLIVIIVTAAFFTRGLFRHSSPANEQGSVSLAAESGAPTGAPQTAVIPNQPPDGGSTSDMCSIASLDLKKDAKFIGVSVHPLDTDATIGMFTLVNNTGCPISINNISFSLSTKATADSIGNIRLFADSKIVAAALPLAGSDDLHMLAFTSLTPNMVTVPAYSSLPLSLKADILPAAPLGQHFALQLYSLDGTNVKMGTPYSWSYQKSLMLVVSNTLSVLP